MLKNILMCFVAACFATGALAQTYSADYQKLRNNKSNYVWMNDMTVENAEFVNMVLCYVKNTGADLVALAGSGAYHAQIDAGKCEASSVTDASQDSASSGGSIQTQSFVVISELVNDKLDVKLWFPTEVENNNGGQTAYTISVRILLPISGEGLDIGIDRLDYILHPANVSTLDADYNPNNAVAYGALITDKVNGGWRVKMGERIMEDLTVIANPRPILPGGINAPDDVKARAASMWFNLVKEGSGTSARLRGYSQGEEWDNNTQAAIYPTYSISLDNQEYLKQKVDSSGVAIGSSQCFDRSRSTFSTWAYNLYDESTGALVKRNSTYRIKHNGKWGNYHQWGAWLGQDGLYSLTFPVNVDIDTGSSSLTAGQLTKRDGKLMKVTSIINTLDELKGIPLDFYNPSPAVQISWNGTNFVKVAELQNGSFAPVTEANYTFPNDISGWQTIGLWSRSTNGEVKINGVRNGNTYTYAFTGQTQLISSLRTDLKGADLAALEGKQFNCLNNCPTISNGVISGSNVNSLSDAVKSYKIIDGVLKSVDGQISYTYSTTVSDLVSNDKNFQSGQLISNDDLSSSALKTRYTCSDNTNFCGYQMWGDSTLGTHYVWSTGEKTWNKNLELVVNGSALALEPQLNVEYSCPSGRSCGGATKVILNYNGPKQLWGIPNKCIDASTLATVSCNADGNKRWVNLFNLTSSPVDAVRATDYVTDLSNRNKKYLLLPQGSEEFYETKGSCSVNPPSESYAASKVVVEDIFLADRAVIGTKPINPNDVLPVVVNGVKVR